MKKRWTILLALVSLVIGVAGASWFWLNFNAQFTNYGFVARTEADIVTKVAVLERIRAGKVAEATHLLETLLDGDLIGAGALAREGTKFNANTRHAVELEIKARAASGYVPSNDNVRKAVQDTFRLMPTSSDDSAAQPTAPRDAPQAARP
jgi:hypothetical protein